MRQHIYGVLLLVIAVCLTACNNAEEQISSDIEDLDTEVLPELTSEIQSLIDYESDLKTIFNDAVSEESLNQFKDDQSELYSNLHKRTEIAAGLTEINGQLQEKAERLNAQNTEESELLNEGQVDNLASAVTALSESVQSVSEHYKDVVSEEESLFAALAEDDADYNTLHNGMEEINTLHETVADSYVSINEQLEQIRENGQIVTAALNGESTDVPDEDLEVEETESHLYTVDGETSKIVPAGEGNPEAVLLTIDDAPDENAVEMAQLLKEQDVPAIFFVNGMFIESEEGQQKLKEIYELGFEIGNHTYNHFNMQEITPEDTRLEIVDTSDLIEEAIGERPRFFRAPFGVNSEASISIAQEEQMTVMNWTYGFDWEAEYQTPEALSDIMVNTDMLGNGANLLMHDRNWTKEALPDIVSGIRDKGYEFIDPAQIDAEGGVTE